MTVQALRKTSMSFDSARRDAAHFIDGVFTNGSTSKFWENRTPLDNSLIGRVPEGGKAEIDAAVRAAKAALSGPWGRMSVTERTDILARVADGINARLEEFLAAECLDTGKPSSLARHLDIPRGAANFKMFADTVKGVSTETFIMPTPDGQGAINYGLRKPKGVIAVISPWNLPLLLMTWKVGPALACGNTVVVKPSEETPLTATLLGEVMNEAGVPKGVYNVVHGFGPNSAGEFLTQHPLVNGITFTGETRTGEAIMRQAALGIRQVSFELGGKNPALVFADADLDKAIEGVMRSCFSNCGQVCLGTERVYVERPIFEAFVARLKAGRGSPEARPSGGPGDRPRPIGQQGAPPEGAELLQDARPKKARPSSPAAAFPKCRPSSPTAPGSSPPSGPASRTPRRSSTRRFSDPAATSARSMTRMRRCDSQTRPLTAWRPRSGPKIFRAAIASRGRWTSASAGSTPGSCATCAPPSAAPSSRALAARAACIRSSSTPS